MKTASLLLLLLTLSFAPAKAHHTCQPTSVEATDQKPNKADREKWFQEAREYKHRFLADELGLSAEQQKEFFQVYDKMQQEIHAVQRNSRKIEKDVYEKGDRATDADYEQATQALYEAKTKEAEITQKYRPEFSKILSPKQMFKLWGAELKFTRQLMDRRQDINKGHKK